MTAPTRMALSALATYLVLAVIVVVMLALIEAYGEINMEACGDFILTDPCLRGKGSSPENVAISDRCSIMSTIHSSKYHACRELMEQVRNLGTPSGE